MLDFWAMDIFSLDVNIFLLALGAICAGLGTGILSGALGIGGGTVMVPLMRLILGMPALSATATSLFVIIPTSISGTITHLQQKTCIPALGVVMGAGGALTSVLGVYLSSISPTWLVMTIAALVIAYSAFSMLRKVKTKKNLQKKENLEQCEEAVQGEEATQGEEAAKSVIRANRANSVNNYQIDESFKFKGSSVHNGQLLGGFGIGIIAGVISGYVGVGGGFIMVPLMCTLLNVSLKRASGTSLIAILILAIPGTIAQCVLGNVNYMVGILLAIGSIPGAILGAKLVKYIPENALRIAFACLLIVAAFLLVVKEFI